MSKMKLTFNFIKGAVINGVEVSHGEDWNEYTLEQVTTILKALEDGYSVRLTNKDNLIIERELIESVTVQV